MPRDFRLQFFFHESISLGHTIRAFFNFFKHLRRYSQLKVHRVVDTSGQWKKSSIRKLFFWIPLVIRVNLKIIFFLQVHLKVSAVWFCSHYCHQCHWHKKKMCYRCCWYRWCTLTWEYVSEFSKKFEMTLMLFSGAWGRWFMKKPEAKNLVTLYL